MYAVAVAIVLCGVSSTHAAQILTRINPWQKAGCIPELIKVINLTPLVAFHTSTNSKSCDG